MSTSKDSCVGKKTTTTIKNKQKHGSYVLIIGMKKKTVNTIRLFSRRKPEFHQVLQKRRCVELFTTCVNTETDLRLQLYISEFQGIPEPAPLSLGSKDACAMSA